MSIGERILDRKQIRIQIVFGKERPHISQYADTAHQGRDQHRFRMQVSCRRDQAETSCYFLVAFLHFLRHDSLVDLPDRNKRSIQCLHVISQKRTEVILRIGCIRHLRPGIEIHSEIIHPPGHIEPDIYPKQKFRHPPDGPQPRTPFHNRINQIDYQPCNTAINEAIADREREKRRKTGQHPRKHRINRTGIPLSHHRKRHSRPDKHQQNHQYNPAQTYIFNHILYIHHANKDR